MLGLRVLAACGRVEMYELVKGIDARVADDGGFEDLADKGCCC